MIEIKAVCTIEEYEKQLARQNEETVEEESDEEPKKDYNLVRVRCIETGEEYDSVSEASEKTGFRTHDIIRSMKKHGFCMGVHFVDASEEDYSTKIEDLPGEIWYDIPGYEGHYQVSNKHRVKSLARQTSRWSKSKGEMSRSVPEYLMNTEDRIPLYVDGIRKFYTLAELERRSFPGRKRLFKLDV